MDDFVIYLVVSVKVVSLCLRRGILVHQGQGSPLCNRNLINEEDVH